MLVLAREGALETDDDLRDEKELLYPADNRDGATDY